MGQTIDCEIACIGHVILHYVHPIVLIQLGLGVQLRHYFRSSLLIFIKQIYRQCFCSSNSESMYFEVNAFVPGLTIQSEKYRSNSVCWQLIMWIMIKLVKVHFMEWEYYIATP